MGCGGFRHFLCEKGAPGWLVGLVSVRSMCGDGFWLSALSSSWAVGCVGSRSIIGFRLVIRALLSWIMWCRGRWRLSWCLIGIIFARLIGAVTARVALGSLKGSLTVVLAPGRRFCAG